eukprot:59848-Hanusia_phi.AAC.5
MVGLTRRGALVVIPGVHVILREDGKLVALGGRDGGEPTALVLHARVMRAGGAEVAADRCRYDVASCQQAVGGGARVASVSCPVVSWLAAPTALIVGLVHIVGEVWLDATRQTQLSLAIVTCIASPLTLTQTVRLRRNVNCIVGFLVPRAAGHAAAVGLVETFSTVPGASSGPGGGDGIGRERGRAGETLLISATLITDVAVHSHEEDAKRPDVVACCCEGHRRADAIHDCGGGSVEVEAGPVRPLRDEGVRELDGQRAQSKVLTEPDPNGVVSVCVEHDRPAPLLLRVNATVVDDHILHSEEGENPRVLLGVKEARVLDRKTDPCSPEIPYVDRYSRACNGSRIDLKPVGPLRVLKAGGFLIFRMRAENACRVHDTIANHHPRRPPGKRRSHSLCVHVGRRDGPSCRERLVSEPIALAREDQGRRGNVVNGAVQLAVVRDHLLACVFAAVSSRSITQTQAPQA